MQRDDETGRKKTTAGTRRRCVRRRSRQRAGWCRAVPRDARLKSCVDIRRPSDCWSPRAVSCHSRTLDRSSISVASSALTPAHPLLTRMHFPSLPKTSYSPAHKNNHLWPSNICWYIRWVVSTELRELVDRLDRVSRKYTAAYLSTSTRPRWWRATT